MSKSLENELPKIRVVLRDDKPINSNGEYTLNYFIRFDGRTIKKPSGLYVSSKDWNKKKGEIAGTSGELIRIQGCSIQRKLISTSTF